MFAHYDGPTAGPDSFSGPIGSLITEDVWKLPILEFERFDNPQLLDAIKSIPSEAFNDLSKDHQYLIKMLEGVLTGAPDDQWKYMKAGPIVHSRWTNTQARTIRQYMSSENPSFELKRLCSFIVFVYGPVFLAAKHFNRVEEGPKILLQELQSVKFHCLPDEIKIVQPIIKNNGFFGHGENILVTLLSSDSLEERIFAVNKVKEIRQLQTKSARGRKKVRPFKIPEDFNVDADSLLDLTDLSKLSTEPPVTKHFSDEELSGFVDVPLNLGLPSSTVAVERGVKMTTEAVKHTADPILQDGLSFQKIAARKRNPLKNRNKKMSNK